MIAAPVAWAAARKDRRAGAWPRRCRRCEERRVEDPDSSFRKRGETLGKGTKFVVYHDLRDGYRWRLRSATGETLAVSGSAHPRKEVCERELELCRAGYPDTPVLDLTGGRSKHTFKHS